MTLAPGISFFSPDGTATIYPATSLPTLDRVSRDTAYIVSAYAFAAIRYRAAKLSEPPLMVVREDDEGTKEWLPDHALADLLDAPSPDYDMGEMLFRTSCYMDITGSCVWLKGLNGVAGVGRLTPFSGQEFAVRATPERMYGAYDLTLATGSLTVGPERVVHFREVNPADWMQGLSLLDVALAWLNLGQSAVGAVRDIMTNALVPPMVVQPHHEWAPDDDELEKYKLALQEYAMPGNRGKPMVMVGGGTMTRLPMTLRDLVPDEVLNRVESVIGSVFGIPPVVLGYLAGLENSPWSQMEEARRMTYEDTIAPLWRRVEKTLTRQLLWAPTTEGGKPLEADRSVQVRYDTTEVRALRVDQAIQATIAAAVAGAKLASRNELRNIIGLEPSDDPKDDELPTGFGVAATLGMPPGAPDKEPPKKPEPEDEDDEDLEDEDAKGEKKALAFSDKAERDLRWKLWDADMRGQELGWQMAAESQLDADRAYVLKLADRYLATEGKAIDPKRIKRFLDALEKDPTLAKAWLAKARPLVQATATRAVEALATDIGVGFSVLSPAVPKYAQAHAATLVQEVTDTTKQAIRDALSTALESGDSLDELRERIMESGAFSTSRAELIARTETTTVTNNAARDALDTWAKENDVKAEKSWLSARDNRVREEHAALDDDTWIPVDEPFANGEDAPGSPNCRCTALYRLPGEE